MSNKLIFSLCLILGIGLAINCFAVDRVVVAEEVYSET
jgi:hypothetical protein